MKFNCKTRSEFEAVEADVYGEPDDEDLSCTTVADLLDELAPGLASREDEDSVEALVAISPITVHAFRRRLSEPAKRARWVDQVSESMAEVLVENHVEELGDPDANVPELTAEEKADLAAVVDRFLTRVGVWQCDAVAAYAYTEADIREVMGAVPADNNTPDA